MKGLPSDEGGTPAIEDLGTSEAEVSCNLLILMHQNHAAHAHEPIVKLADSDAC